MLNFCFVRRPTTIQWKWNEQGERIRVSVRSGKEITIPAKELVTFEYKHPDSYKGLKIEPRYMMFQRKFLLV